MERDDIVFGETLSGRNSSVDGIEDIMGPCITTVPMRVKMDGRQGIRQFLDQMQAQSTAMIPFQHIGLQALRALGPEIRPSLEFNNLFEIVMLEVMDQAQETAKEQQFIHEIENKKLLEGFFNTYALVMECVVRNNQVSLEVKFDHNVLSEWQVERLCSHFEKVVDQFSTLSSNATNTGTLDDLEMVSQQDMALIRSWNTQNNIEYVDSAVHDIFAEQVRASPHSLAISSWDGEMTYHQLDELSTILAKTLVSRWEVKVEDVIPLCFEKSKWAIVAALGVVKAGGAVAHLGSSDPLSRRKEVLHQTKARFIITSPKQADSFDGIEGLTPLLLIDDQRIQHMRLIQKAERAVVSLPKVSSRNAVYVLFTSGSTGQPKGIVVEHGNLSTSSRTHGATFNINAGTRVFQFAAYTFDVSCADIFTSLQRGATVCVPSEEERVNDLANAITRYNADWMFATPTVARLLDPESVPTLRTLVLGGEAPTKDNIESWACREDLQLMFTWGPAETTIYASASAPITLESSPKRLGKAMGCRMWLCDPMDHNKLVPIGCVGEIVVEGGIVSRGYMDEEKTTAVYFQNPSWLRQDMVERDNPPHCHRMYKTGDLARYDMDGIMRYVGRKDDQVKLQGQRIELAEVEHHILTRPGVHRALTRVPRAGPLKDKLVAVISFLGTSSDQSNNTGNNSSCLIPLSHTGKQPVNFEDIRQGLNYSLPSYMVPSFYVAVEAIPMNSNGKIDRKITGQWLEGMDLELYKTLMTTMVGTGDESEQHASTQEEAIVLSLVSRVLNLTDGSARLGLSFLNQGGDSITAMQLRTKAKAEGLNITMQDILKSQSLSAIASAAKSTKMSKQADEVAIAIEAQPKKHSEQPDISFGLSPIQQLFFEAASQYSTTPASLSFNQSFLLRINRTVTEQEMGCALEALVTRHAMLRARFSKAPDGQWSQSISDRPVNKSFSFRVDHTETVSDVTEILTTRGGNLVMGNVEDGPLFVAHMFNISGKDLEKSAQQLFLSAHHLVVDLVSWRIILNDLQDLLTTGVMAAGSPVPYQTWLQLQQEYALTLKPESVLPLESISEAHIDYWGLDKTSRNTFDQLAERQFLLSEEVTTKLFGPSNQAFNTEPVDIILASIATAFQEIFTDRSMPHIFAEGHGRESWDESIDPNGTVGWFTTMSPIQVPSSSTDLATNVRMMKDTRRRIPRNGMPYFSSRFLTQDGRERLGQHAGPIEILFNYVGKYQQLESKDALFAEVDRELWGQAAEVCGDVNRFALIDIGVVVADGKTRVAFAYNKNMLHQEMISTWIDRTESIITRGVETLKGMTQSRTMGDFPLLISQLNTEKLALVERSLSDTGESMGTILDMYPCTPMQQHILTVQNKEGQRLHGRQKLYEVEISHQILSRPANTVSLEQLQTAWQHVIDEHPILRTIFVSAPQTGDNEPNYLQVVLSSYHANVPIIQCEDETELLRRVKEFRSVNYQNLATPHHQFTIFTTGDGQKVTCKLEISHALNDGISTGILFRDLEVAYRKRSKLTKVQLRGTGFGDYMAWLEGQKTQDAEDHWYKLIQGATCGSSRSIVPHQHEKSQTPTQKSLEINLNRTLVAALTSFCHYHGVTLATFFQTVWGLVLQSQAQSETKELKKIEVTPFFGYMMANRDAVDGRCENMVGPLTNMLLAETDVPANTRIGELLRRRQSEFLEALTHQFGLAGAVKKARGTQASSGKISNVERGGNWDGSLGGLCNSIMSLQYVDADGGHIPQDTTKRPRPLSMIQASARKTLSMTRGSHHTSSRSFSEGFNARSQPEDYTRVPNSGRKLRHVSWSGNSMISKHDLNWRLSQKSKASTENEITFRPLAYQDPNDYDISLGVQVLKAPQSDRRDGVHVKAQLVYWSDVISDGRAETMRRAFERCAEELVSDGTGCLRVWVLLRRIAPSA